MKLSKRIKHEERTAVKKKLMLLGGSRYLLPIIRKAHELGLYVITCDYLPDNIAHKYADQYCDISIIDKDAVYEAAKENYIDGIMSFACDPGVVTAAYVAEKMGLPFQCSYDAARLLQDKGLFRAFLKENGFNTPTAKRYGSGDDPSSDIDFFHWPVIVKPVDSAGSKGVTRVDDPAYLSEAINTAVNLSHCGSYIIEDFLTFSGFHTDTDLFLVKGKLEFITYSDQVFDPGADNQYTPSLIIWPSTMAMKHQKYLTQETQRLMDLLGMRDGIYNIETCVDIDGKPYLMEVSPRGGGCKIAEIQEMAMGAHLIENEIRKAVGMEGIDFGIHECDGVWCEMVIHMEAGQSGYFERLEIDSTIKENYVKVIDLAVKPGEWVGPFTGANMALGDMFLRFDSREELDSVMAKVREWLKICVK